jgi:hypothetical protein
LNATLFAAVAQAFERRAELICVFSFETTWRCCHHESDCERLGTTITGRSA